jgi:hypothetical protein
MKSLWEIAKYEPRVRDDADADPAARIRTASRDRQILDNGDSRGY